MPDSCPSCGGPVRSGEVDGRTTSACLWCGKTPALLQEAAETPKLPRRRARRSNAEDEVQKQIVEALRGCGYTVLVTSRRRHRCRCGLWSSAGDGCDKGIPDLFVALEAIVPDDGIAKWMWRGLEVKGPKTPVSPEQQALADAGHITIVRSVEEAFKAVGE